MKLSLEQKLARRKVLIEELLEARRQFRDREIGVGRYIRKAFSVYFSDVRAYFAARAEFRKIDFYQDSQAKI